MRKKNSAFWLSENPGKGVMEYQSYLRGDDDPVVFGLNTDTLMLNMRKRAGRISSAPDRDEVNEI